MSATPLKQFDHLSGILTYKSHETSVPSAFNASRGMGGSKEVTLGEMTLTDGQRLSVEVDGEWGKGAQISGIFNFMQGGRAIISPAYETGKGDPAAALAEAKAAQDYYASRTDCLLKVGMAVSLK